MGTTMNAAMNFFFGYSSAGVLLKSNTTLGDLLS